MRNLGPVSRRWLREAEIHDMEDLRRVGSIAAFLRVRLQQPKVSLNLLWALEGALLDVDCRQLPPGIKQALLAAIEQTTSS